MLRLPLPLLVLVLLPNVTGDLLARQLTKLPYAHGAVKFGLEVWQSLLIRQDRVGGVIVLTAAGGALITGLRGRVRLVAMALLAAASIAVLRPTTWAYVPALALILANLSLRLPRGLAWIPGVELLLPVPLARVLTSSTIVPRVVATLALPVLALFGILADTSRGFAGYERQLAAGWPAELEDPRVTVLERALSGVKCEYHDIDIVGDRALVVAEGTHRLMSVPDGATYRLPELWGPNKGLTLDSETDPATDTTWFVDGPEYVSAVRWEAGAFVNVGRSVRMPRPMHHSYLYRIHELGRLVLFTVGVGDPRGGAEMQTLDLPGMTDPKAFWLTTADGRRVPTLRDAVWIPPLRRFVAVPDMGSRLYLVDAETGASEAWLEMPTLNGRPRWIDALGKLYVPMPNRAELWEVDPVTEEVRHIRTQPGVRTLEVDVERNLLITASVLTGIVLVQRLDDGSYVDSFRTLMPMARMLTILPGTGAAMLSTWTSLYRIPYAAVP